MNPTKGSGGTAGGTTVGSGGSISGSAGKTGGGGSAGGKSSSGGSAGSTQMCYVDAPCQSSFRCVSSNSYQARTTNWDCHAACGPGPCSGAFCEDSGSPIACPAGTQCVAGGFNNPNEGCRPIPDAGVKDPADAAASDTGSLDTQGADRGLKAPLDALADTSQKRLLDVRAPDVARICVPGEQRCKGNEGVIETCAPDGDWWRARLCDYACRDNACVGECDTGIRRRCRANSNIPQACDSTSTWVDEPACSGSTPYCAIGQCVAACLDEGQDCTDATTSCCAGSECVAADGRTLIYPGSGKFSCKAIPACAGPGLACASNTDCCASMDCTGGKCMPKQAACLDAPADGVCGGSSGATCCPGTECKSLYSFEPLRCMIASNPQETGCPREQPAFHEACRASKLGLGCTYQDWDKQPGVFFQCICSYHGWSCSKGHYAH